MKSVQTLVKIAKWFLTRFGKIKLTLFPMVLPLMVLSVICAG